VQLIVVHGRSPVWRTHPCIQFLWNRNSATGAQPWRRKDSGRGEGSAASYVCSRARDPNYSRVSWHDRSALVSGRTFHCRNLFRRTHAETFDVGTQRWSALHLKFDVAFPEWSGDSQFFYFQESSGDDRGIYRIRAKGGEVEKVIDLKNWHLAGWTGWTTLDPTDAPLVLRDTGSTYIYALTLEQK
jgi:hypothetical protein